MYEMNKQSSITII